MLFLSVLLFSSIFFIDTIFCAEKIFIEVQVEKIPMTEEGGEMELEENVICKMYIKILEK